MAPSQPKAQLRVSFFEQTDKGQGLAVIVDHGGYPDLLGAKGPYGGHDIFVGRIKYRFDDLHLVASPLQASGNIAQTEGLLRGQVD